jgi:hypothetical protein
MPQEKTEFEKFDAVVRKIFSVPHDEIVRREKEYQRKRKRAKQKRAKTSPASRASSGKS